MGEEFLSAKFKLDILFGVLDILNFQVFKKFQIQNNLFYKI